MGFATEENGGCLLLFLAGIVVDFDFGFGCAEEFLGAEEGVAGREVWIARVMEEEVGFAFFAVAALLESLEDSGFFEDFVDVAAGARDENVTVLVADKFDEVFEGDDAGGVEVSGIFESQDDNLEVLIERNALDLGAEEFGSAKKKVAFDVDDGNGGIGAGSFFSELAEVSAVGDFVFDEVWFGSATKEEGDGKGDADEDGDVERGDEGREEGADEDSGVVASGKEADLDVALGNE